jgi:hypothetical protein
MAASPISAARYFPIGLSRVGGSMIKKVRAVEAGPLD